MSLLDIKREDTREGFVEAIRDCLGLTKGRQRQSFARSDRMRWATLIDNQKKIPLVEECRRRKFHIPLQVQLQGCPIHLSSQGSTAEEQLAILVANEWKKAGVKSLV